MKFFIIALVGLLSLSDCSKPLELVESGGPYSDNDGLLFYSALRCSNLAGYHNNSDEQLRLFELGNKVGKEFVRRTIDKSMDESEWEKAPVGITWELGGGPSIDFRLGYIYKSIETDVYATVTKKDENGVLFNDVLDWRDDKERQVYSMQLFQNSNCSLLT